jgi:hypothetical protein
MCPFASAMRCFSSLVSTEDLRISNGSLGLIGIHETELSLSDDDDVEREAIGAECFDRFFIREELEFLTSHEDLEHAIAGNECRSLFSAGEPSSGASAASMISVASCMRQAA